MTDLLFWHDFCYNIVRLRCDCTPSSQIADIEVPDRHPILRPHPKGHRSMILKLSEKEFSKVVKAVTLLIGGLAIFVICLLKWL